MKKIVFYTVALCTITASMVTFADQKQTDDTHQETDVQDTEKKKIASAWYKKPAVKYAAGGLLSAAVGTYAFLQYMRGDVTPLPKQNDSSTDSVNNTDSKIEIGTNTTLTNQGSSQELDNETVVPEKKSGAKVVAGIILTGSLAATAVGISYLIPHISQWWP